MLLLLSVKEEYVGRDSCIMYSSIYTSVHLYTVETPVPSKDMYICTEEAPVPSTTDACVPSTWMLLYQGKMPLWFKGLTLSTKN